jgi:RNA polymerase sigma-32 factor
MPRTPTTSTPRPKRRPTPPAGPESTSPPAAVTGPTPADAPPADGEEAEAEAAEGELVSPGELVGDPSELVGDLDAGGTPLAPDEADPGLPEPEAADGELVDDAELIDLGDRAPRARATDEDSSRALTTRDPLTAYVQQIRRFPLLSREEEHTLAVEFLKTRDPAIRTRLIASNLRLVVKLAHEYRRAYRNLLDLVQEGNVGLVQAVDKYDPYRGVKLSSYAAWWIRAYILKFILNNWRLVKIGTTQAQRKLFFNLKKEKDKLQAEGFDPQPKLLAERLDVTEQEVREMESRLSAADFSLDAPLSRDDSEGRSHLDMVPSAEGMRPDARMEGEEFQQLLRGKLEAFAKTLNGREQTIFQERLLAPEPLTLKEIGEKYGISRERARQLEKRMLDRLRVYLRREIGEAVDIALGIEE